MVEEVEVAERIKLFTRRGGGREGADEEVTSVDWKGSLGHI